MTFTLHSDLIRDGIPMGHFDMCQVLLINDATYPWFVLVPMRPGISDPIDLTPADHSQLWAESYVFGAGIMRAFAGEKLNVAALGNMTPQLHVHHVVRYKNDAAWPGPIWGKVPMAAYAPTDIEAVQAKLLAANMVGFTAT